MYVPCMHALHCMERCFQAAIQTNSDESRIAWCDARLARAQYHNAHSTQHLCCKCTCMMCGQAPHHSAHLVCDSMSLSILQHVLARPCHCAQLCRAPNSFKDRQRPEVSLPAQRTVPSCSLCRLLGRCGCSQVALHMATGGSMRRPSSQMR
jgi:hypothetical protein